MYTVRYFVRRVSVYLATVWSAVIINFAIPRLIPGNPIRQRLFELRRQGQYIGGEEFIEKFSRMFALDQPMHMQFVTYIRNLLQGNLGYSINNFPAGVSEIIARSLPWTIGLLAVSLMVSFALGTILGAYFGWLKRSGGKLPKFGFAISVILSRIPFYVLGMILIYLFIYYWALFPYGGAVIPRAGIGYILEILSRAALPALTIVLIGMGGWAIQARGLMVGILGEDYLFLAKAKGLEEKYVFAQYALRNTLLPQITDLAISLGGVVSGSIIVEMVYSYPGIGQTLLTAIRSLDYPVIQGVVLIIILGITTSALMIDLLYPLIDPRIGGE